VSHVAKRSSDCTGRAGPHPTSGTPSTLRHSLWGGMLGLVTLALVSALTLIAVLALGWNNPRPTGAPDWQASGLPLYLEARSNQTTMTLLSHPNSDFVLEVEAIPISGPDFNGYGLAYRAQDSVHYYTFAIGGDGYYAILKVMETEDIPLVEWQQFPHIRRGRQANRLRAACTGPTCHFYINDEYATSVEDGTWLTGDVGLWVRSFEDGDVAVHFVDVRVW